MSGVHKRILNPLTWRKKRKACNKTREKYMPEKRRQKLAKQTGNHITKQEEWLEAFLDDKSAFLQNRCS